MAKPVERCILKPCKGRRVRDPFTLRVLADEGEEKELTTYWLRRLNDGDVVRCDNHKELSEE